MTSLSAYPFVLDSKENGVHSERDFLGLDLLEQMFKKEKAGTSDDYFFKYYDISILPLEKKRGFICCPFYTEESKDCNYSGPALITTNTSPPYGFRDSIIFTATYGPASTTQVSVKNLPALAADSLDISLISKDTNKSIILNIENAWTDLSGRILSDPEEKVQNRICMVDLPGIYATKTTKTEYGSFVISESNRFETANYIKGLPEVIKKRLIYEAGGIQEEKVVFGTTVSPSFNEMTKRGFVLKDIFEEPSDLEGIVKPSFSILEGPSVAKVSHPRTKLSAPILENQTKTPLNVYRLNPNDHKTIVEIESPTNLWYLVPGVKKMIVFSAVVENGDGNAINDPIFELNYSTPVVIDGSLRVGGHLNHYVITARSFLLDQKVYEYLEEEMLEQRYCTTESFQTSMPSFPVDSEVVIGLENIKYLVTGLSVYVKSSETNIQTNPFHPITWHRSGLPVKKKYIFEDSNFSEGFKPNHPQKTRRFKHVISGEIRVVISGFVDPIISIGINVQGAPLFSVVNPVAMTLSEFIAGSDQLPWDTCRNLVPITKNGFKGDNFYGINLHQFSKVAMYVKFTRKVNEIDIESVINKGGVSIIVESRSSNSFINNNQGNLCRKYYN